MTEKFTKGPWRLSENGGVFGDDGVDDCRMVASCTGYSRTKDSSFVLAQNHANAHLISAAPDMFCALKAIVTHFDDNSDSENNPADAMYEALLIGPARAALAKARGEQND